MLSAEAGLVGYAPAMQIIPGKPPPEDEKELWDASVMRVNVERERIVENIRHSITLQLPQLRPHAESPNHIAIVGGGWSLDETYHDLRALYHDGVKLVALNGSAKWLMERNLRPSVHIMLDARPGNIAFVTEAVPHCQYFLASQCAPELFAAVADRNVTIFQAVPKEGDIETQLLDGYYGEGRWIRVPTAGTVGVTSLMVMRLLGFRYQHLFGLDSCFSPEGKHHAYAQAMNDRDGSGIFEIAGRRFRCAAWQAAQAQNFMDMLSINGDHVQLAVYGDGMLAHILKTGATLMDEVS